jgi:hypothetical protein
MIKRYVILIVGISVSLHTMEKERLPVLQENAHIPSNHTPHIKDIIKNSDIEKFNTYLRTQAQAIFDKTAIHDIDLDDT